MQGKRDEEAYLVDLMVLEAAAEETRHRLLHGVNLHEIPDLTQLWHYNMVTKRKKKEPQ